MKTKMQPSKCMKGCRAVECKDKVIKTHGFSPAISVGGNVTDEVSVLVVASYVAHETLLASCRALLFRIAAVVNIELEVIGRSHVEEGSAKSRIRGQEMRKSKK